MITRFASKTTDNNAELLILLFTDIVCTVDCFPYFPEIFNRISS